MSTEQMSESTADADMMMSVDETSSNISSLSASSATVVPPTPGTVISPSADCVDLDDDSNVSSTVTAVPTASVVRSVSKKSTGSVQKVIKTDFTAPQPPDNSNPTNKKGPPQDNLRLSQMNAKFMQDFDPTNSSRNLQKRKKRYHPVDGRLIQYADDFDDCDCLRPACPGCHYPCKSCGDSRCGHECRVNRKWVYDSVEIEGRNVELKNPHAASFTN